MARAVWNDTVVAESDSYETVEGNVYFPASSLETAFFRDSDHTTVCGWKGTASYYHLVVNGSQNDNAAWYYPEPKPAAANIKGHVAFWRGVHVEV